MKIFSAEQIYKADKATLEKQDISSEELMERAATQMFNWMHVRMQGAPVKIHLFCGIGNNGGDGIALARHLFEHGYDIAVYVVKYSDKRSNDFLVNLERLKDRKIWPVFLDDKSDLPNISQDDIIVDAVFGIGLNRTPDDWVTKLISHLNDSKAFILAVDIPSGLFTNCVPENLDSVIKANYVLSFQVPKLVFFLPQTGVFVEQWEVLDIGLDSEFLMKEETEYDLIAKSEVLQFYRPRTKYSHKGTYGHALIVGGSYGKIGAVTLSSKAALKSGSGLVTTYIPECGYQILQTSVPEIMVLTNGKTSLETIDFDIKPTVVGIGMGMGIGERTAKALTEFLKVNKLPLVLDADALNILSKNKESLKYLPEESILTPHPKELERLIGKWKDDFDKLKKVKAFSKKYKTIIIIKGAHTITFYQGKGYINTTGNPGMATAGSGDTLTGVITGLIAQGYTNMQAAIFGVYLHGKSGDLALEKTGYQSLVASDIINGLGQAFIDLFKVPEQVSEQQEEDKKENVK
ncbi:NAD(P)H-hydrate dehydratase [Maribacter sp. PR1]|uniref:Bifunctional NAD(P)H-hydrate repair enzyme n=1 Tax=Maribacter cobaltidurans TaxID=1178778 RepID=A0ABU7IWW5_9FLAO|nr:MULTISPECIES: NAD(P)H-hydrate dehydratase [Maribacter]MDC6389933.1 NAD(P)H-hydrate dehydratase [Maribacter sp. PR1]MEE1977323.1 NAD(P)H-hydrate dehydratase [Maribacter cobaltidurans]